MNCQPFEGGSGTYYRWQSATCRAGLCKAESGLAFCVASVDPNPQCTELRDAVCDGNTMRDCIDGYASDPGTVCALCREYDADPSADVDRPGAQCIQETSRNANCPNAPAGSGISGACDGNDAIQCEEGLVVKRQACGTGFCVGINQCALSKAPDPNCIPGESSALGSTSSSRSATLGGFCDGNTAVTCDSGYRVAESPCPGGEVCQAWPTTCSNPADSSCTVPLCVAQ